MPQPIRVALLLLLIAISLHAQKRVHPEIWSAQSVMVTAFDGSNVRGLDDSKIALDERAIISEVEDRFRKWGRYHVVNHLDDADIVVVVRKGSRLSIETNAGSRIPGSGPVADIRGTGDLFAIYPGRTDEPLRGPILWSVTEKDGLKIPELKAFQKFRKRVEESEKPSKP
jgi:hypothetical protein